MTLDLSKVKVGDKLRITKTGTHIFAVGDIVTVQFKDNSRQPLRCGPEHSSTWLYASEAELVDQDTPVTVAEVADSVAVAPEDRIEGNTFEVVADRGGFWTWFQPGQKVVLDEILNDKKGYFKGNNRDDNDQIITQVLKFSQVKAVEVAEAPVEDKEPKLVKEKGKKLANAVYSVVNKADVDNPYDITTDRQWARELKASLGGKKEGFLILKYEAVKEIR